MLINPEFVNDANSNRATYNKFELKKKIKMDFCLNFDKSHEIGPNRPANYTKTLK